jgi:hypothetical protein
VNSAWTQQKAKTGALALASGARINLGMSGLEIAAGGTTLADLRSAVLLARGTAGTMGSDGKLIIPWNGTSGIGSANVDPSKSRAIGYRQMPSGAFQVAWAAYGDTNLDGRVNSTDVTAVGSGKKFGLPSTDRSSHWSQGDFNYDGRVTSTDILQISPLFGKPSYYTAAATSSSSVVDAPNASLTAQLFAALGGIDQDGDGKA